MSIHETIRRYETRATDTLAPVVWDRAEGYQVFDRYGNCWIDFTSGIYVANIGHAHPDVISALQRQLDGKLLHSYLFCTEVRARLVEKLVHISPPNLTKVFLASTGSESIECALKLSRLHGQKVDLAKTVIVSFQGAFHGRTMGSQMLASAPDHKDWITHLDPDIRHIPFPNQECGADFFAQGLSDLRAEGVDTDRIAAFVMEGYQGIGGPLFYPTAYVQAMRQWADAHRALVVVDEIQSGFGRTGKLFAYEHYGIEADLVCCGKGISSCLPLSAVLGRGQIMDLPQPGDMTTTHTGNPLCCAAAMAVLEVMEREHLVEGAAGKGRIFERRLNEILKRHPDRVSRILGRGMVYAIVFKRPGTDEPDVALAKRVTDRAIENGLMLFHAHSSGSVKMGPPLIIPDDVLEEGLSVLEEAAEACLAEG